MKEYNESICDDEEERVRAKHRRLNTFLDRMSKTINSKNTIIIFVTFKRLKEQFDKNTKYKDQKSI